MYNKDIILLKIGTRVTSSYRNKLEVQNYVHS